MTMEAGKFHNRASVNWRSREASSMAQSKPNGLGTRAASSVTLSSRLKLQNLGVEGQLVQVPESKGQRPCSDSKGRRGRCLSSRRERERWSIYLSSTFYMQALS